MRFPIHMRFVCGGDRELGVCGGGLEASPYTPMRVGRMTSWAVEVCLLVWLAASFTGMATPRIVDHADMIPANPTVAAGLDNSAEPLSVVLCANSMSSAISLASQGAVEQGARHNEATLDLSLGRGETGASGYPAAHRVRHSVEDSQARQSHQASV